MLYPTQNQTLLILVIALIGFGCGLLFNFAYLLSCFFKRNKFFTQVFYFISTILSGIILFFVNLNLNYGEFRIFVLIEFLFFLLLEMFTIGKLWTKTIDKCYNQIEKFRAKLTKGKKWKKNKKNQKTWKILLRFLL